VTLAISAAEAVELAESVGKRVLAPLTLGDELRPVAPIGARRALAAAELDLELPSAVQNDVLDARLSITRRLAPIDRLPLPGRAEWLLVFALNDLLQATNASLEGPFARDRAERLVEMASEVVAHAGAPATVLEAIARHATLSRVVELERRDTTVSWWVGSRSFAGARPPARLLAWRKLRRVEEHVKTVPIFEMPRADRRWASRWSEVLRALLAATPLTDLVAADRRAPPFAFTGATLGLVRTHVGRFIALRALERAPDPDAVARALLKAADEIDEPTGKAKKLVRAFVSEIRVPSGQYPSVL